MILVYWQTDKVKVIQILSYPFLLIYSDSKKAKKMYISKELISSFLKKLLPSQL